MPSGLFYLHSSDQSISNSRGIWLALLLPCFTEIREFNANSIDPGQTPRSAASDLGLHCLPMFLSRDVRHKWINNHTDQVLRLFLFSAYSYLSHFS